MPSDDRDIAPKPPQLRPSTAYSGWNDGAWRIVDWQLSARAHPLYRMGTTSASRRQPAE
jgi:hypothetical protein